MTYGLNLSSRRRSCTASASARSWYTPTRTVKSPPLRPAGVTAYAGKPRAYRLRTMLSALARSLKAPTWIAKPAAEAVQERLRDDKFKPYVIKQ